MDRGGWKAGWELNNCLLERWEWSGLIRGFRIIDRLLSISGHINALRSDIRQQTLEPEKSSANAPELSNRWCTCPFIPSQHFIPYKSNVRPLCQVRNQTTQGETEWTCSNQEAQWAGIALFIPLPIVLSNIYIILTLTEVIQRSLFMSTICFSSTINHCAVRIDLQLGKETALVRDEWDPP